MGFKEKIKSTMSLDVSEQQKLDYIDFSASVYANLNIRGDDDLLSFVEDNLKDKLNNLPLFLEQEAVK